MTDSASKYNLSNSSIGAFTTESTVNGQVNNISMGEAKEATNPQVAVPELLDDNLDAPNQILFLAANPKDTTRMRLAEELREIGESLRLSEKRDQFHLESRGAVRIKDLRRAVMKIKPQIVHFSGHGADAEGLVLEGNDGKAVFMSTERLEALFELFAEDGLKCVVLNACYSETQARAIQKHIPYVIGMSQSIADRAAIDFATAFYDAIGDGRDFEYAFKVGRSDLDKPSIAQLLKQSEYQDEPLAAATQASAVGAGGASSTSASELRDDVAFARLAEADEETLLEEIGEIVRSPSMTERGLSVLQTYQSDTAERSIFQSSATAGRQVLEGLSPRAHKLLCSPIEGDGELAQELTRLMDENTQEAARRAMKLMGDVLLTSRLGLPQQVAMRVSVLLVRNIARGTSDLICDRWAETLNVEA